MVDRNLGVASQHSNGKLPISLEIGRALAEKFEFEHGQFSGTEASHDDSDLDSEQSDEF